MILMSDTGGGHRASADAIKAGFHILYGDKYEVRHLGRGESKLAAWQHFAQLHVSPGSRLIRTSKALVSALHPRTGPEITATATSPSKIRMGWRQALPLAAKIEGYRQSMCLRQGQQLIWGHMQHNPATGGRAGMHWHSAACAQGVGLTLPARCCPTPGPSTLRPSSRQDLHD